MVLGEKGEAFAPPGAGSQQKAPQGTSVSPFRVTRAPQRRASSPTRLRLRPLNRNTFHLARKPFFGSSRNRPVRVDVVHITKNASSSKESGPVRGPVGLGRAEAVSPARGTAARL